MDNPFHLHVHHEPDDRVIALLTEILTRVRAVEAREVDLMAKEQDLQDDMDAIKTGVTGLLAQVNALIAAGPGAVTQAQLDALDAEAKGITAVLTPPPATT